MFKLSAHHKRKLHHHGEKISQKLSHLTRESHHHKIILHTRKEEQVMKFPLLLGIIVTLLFPIFVGILLLVFLLYGGNLIVEREE